MTSAAPAPHLSLAPDRGFVLATGVECSAPMIAGGIRQDLLRKTGHWDRYEEDISLIAATGIRYLRYGVPFHVVAHDESTFDWDWTDRALGAIRDSGLEPIIDLLHFGVPDDLWGFGDPRLQPRFRRYAAAFAERFPWVRWYTPVNEPLVTSSFSAELGWWNERRRDQRSFVAAIDGTAACAVLATEEIRARRPDAVFLQSDACESWTPAAAIAHEQAQFLQERRFVAWDLVYGRRPGESVVRWLEANGVGPDRLAWYEAHGSDENVIVGHDYYAGNEWIVEAGGVTRQAEAHERRGYAAIAREYHAHFGLPFMLSETNWDGDAAPDWLARTWNETLNLRLEGLPVRGYTWYGFVDHVDWESCLVRAAGQVNACGLVGLDRRRHPVGEVYTRLAQDALRGEFHPLPVLDAPEPGGLVAIPELIADLARRAMHAGESAV